MAGAHHSSAADDHDLEKEDPKALMAEDSEAWHGVTGLLIGIVSVGVLLAFWTFFNAL
ncbi:MAG: hypothetical protein U0894_02720 [Pirellulales bacterium]